MQGYRTLIVPGVLFVAPALARWGFQGDRAAHEVADASDRAEATIEVLDLGESQWRALAEPLTLLKNFLASLSKAKGEKPMGVIEIIALVDTQLAALDRNSEEAKAV